MTLALATCSWILESGATCERSPNHMGHHCPDIIDCRYTHESEGLPYIAPRMVDHGHGYLGMPVDRFMGRESLW